MGKFSLLSIWQPCHSIPDVVLTGDRVRVAGKSKPVLQRFLFGLYKKVSKEKNSVSNNYFYKKKFFVDNYRINFYRGLCLKSRDPFQSSFLFAKSSRNAKERTNALFSRTNEAL